MKGKRIKKTNYYQGLVIKLYEADVNDYSKNRNIECYDLNGNLIWVVEAPAYGNNFFDIQIDEENNYLEADVGTGRKYNIDLKDGHIINSFLVK
jgi:hypothetical protein